MMQFDTLAFQQKPSKSMRRVAIFVRDYVRKLRPQENNARERSTLGCLRQFRSSERMVAPPVTPPASGFVVFRPSHFVTTSFHFTQAITQICFCELHFDSLTKSISDDVKLRGKVNQSNTKPWLPDDSSLQPTCVSMLRGVNGRTDKHFRCITQETHLLGHPQFMSQNTFVRVGQTHKHWCLVRSVTLIILT